MGRNLILRQLCFSLLDSQKKLQKLNNNLEDKLLTVVGYSAPYLNSSSDCSKLGHCTGFYKSKLGHCTGFYKSNRGPVPTGEFPCLQFHCFCIILTKI